MLILIWIFQFGCKVIVKPSVCVLGLRNGHYVSLNSNFLHLDVQSMMLLYKF